MQPVHVCDMMSLHMMYWECCLHQEESETEPDASSGPSIVSLATSSQVNV